MSSGPNTSIELAISADNQYLRERLGASATILDGTSPLKDLRGRLTEDAGRGLLGQGLVIFYSGHGFRKASAADGRVESHLCSDSPQQSVRGLVEHVAQLTPRPAWAIFVVNACESAYVDLSEFQLPMALISASPQPVTLHNVPRPDPAQPNQRIPPSPFTKGFADVWARPEIPEHDLNGDGMVSSRELVYAIRKAAFAAERESRPSFLEPHLQLQADSDLPVRYTDKAPPARPELTELLVLLQSSNSADQTVATALQAQLERQGLAKVPFDWVGIRGEQDEVARCPVSMLRTDRRNASASPSLRCPPNGLGWRALETFARFAAFMEVYQLVRHGSFWDVIRLRDGRLMSTIQGDAPLEGTPRRFTRVLERADGFDVYRVSGMLPNPEDCQVQLADDCAAIKGREFAVCWEEEGQCFISKRTAP